ncbi:MAG: SMP-30/gluconolactonase/LRE family protein [bacterium]|nr:SMP-30/gluconolactonase/LRE family protein [bacterium]
MSSKLSAKSTFTGVLLTLLVFATSVFGQSEIIEFDSDRWDIQFGRVEEYLGQKSLWGRANLKDVEFENGVIEYDVAFEGGRCFGGILFRIQDAGNAENFYMRPHKSNLPDALQFQSIINGQSSWQLYSNEGFAEAAEIPHKEWIHVKMEISGTHVRVFFNNSEEPAIEIDDLKREPAKGGITVAGPGNKLAHFANFTYRIDNNLVFKERRKYTLPHGILDDWVVSQPITYYDINTDDYPDENELSGIEWIPTECEHTGLVNVAWYGSRPANIPYGLYAKTVIHAEKDEVRRFDLGYSDIASVFINGEQVFRGRSDFRRRDPSFLGVIGLFDSIYLPLKKGDNEIFITLLDVFGGWGFIMKDASSVYMDESIEKVWDTGSKFKYPESAVYDEKRDAVYITNFDQFYPSRAEGIQSISRLTTDGEIEDMDWISGFFNPTGMEIYNDKLYVADRRGVAVVDIDKREIIERYAIRAGFLNDLAIDGSGNIYVTDSQMSTIYKIVDGKPEKWMTNEEIINTNGLCIQGDRMLLGNSGDNRLKYVDLNTKEIQTLFEFEPGIIDGIKVDENGNYLVSVFDGKIYRVTPDGQATKLLDTSATNHFCADFEYIPSKKLLIIPTMGNCIVRAFRIKDGNR